MTKLRHKFHEQIGSVLPCNLREAPVHIIIGGVKMEWRLASSEEQIRAEILIIWSSFQASGILHYETWDSNLALSIVPRLRRKVCHILKFSSEHTHTSHIEVSFFLNIIH